MNSAPKSNEAVELVEAREISERAWCVLGKPFNGEHLEIQLSNIEDTYRFVLTVRNNHSNIKLFNKLNFGDVVKFELVYLPQNNSDPKVSDYLIFQSVCPY